MVCELCFNKIFLPILEALLIVLHIHPNLMCSILPLKLYLWANLLYSNSCGLDIQVFVWLSKV